MKTDLHDNERTFLDISFLSVVITVKNGWHFYSNEMFLYGMLPSIYKRAHVLRTTVSHFGNRKKNDGRAEKHLFSINLVSP